MIDHDDLARVWRLLREDGSVIAPALRLVPGGTIDGLDEPNAVSWKVVNGSLCLLRRDGSTSIVFDRDDRTRPGNVRLKGRVVCLGAEGAVRLLEQAHALAANAIGLVEVLDVTPSSILLRASAAVRKLFAEREIALGRRARPFAADTIEVGSGARIEPYASFCPGSVLCTMGAFSYSESPLPPDLAVGRYCSIAIGFEVLLDRHPVEWATTSAVTYDADPLVGYPALAAAHRDFNPGGFVLAEPPGLLAPAPRIGHDVWIGQYAQTARDITIGHGAVVGAGAVVTRDVLPYAIVTGVPARTLRMRFEPDVIEALLDSRWWEFDASVVRRCDFRDPGRFAAQVMSLPDSERWRPEPVTPESLLRALQH